MNPASSTTVDDDVIPIPDVSGLITEDDTPVDNVFSEKQMRLLTEPLYASWRAPDQGPFFLAANVGVFPTPSNDPLVPDVFLSFDTAPKHPFDEKKGRSYFVWEHGKPPDIVIEIVSNKEGDELTRKLRGYERMRVAHYVVFDPWKLLSEEAEVTRFRLDGDTLVEEPGELRLPRPNLGLTRWKGAYENEQAEWLRWCLADGSIVPTGAERALAEAERADSEMERADDERKRADDERKRADDEKKRADRLAALLRELGHAPD